MLRPGISKVDFHSEVQATIMQQILFVCLGNICRSPLAETVFRQEAQKLALKVEARSAAVSSWHISEKPDPRAVSVGLERGFDISDHRACLIQRHDIAMSNMVLALDEDVYRRLIEIADAQAVNKIRLLTDFAEHSTVRDVQTPYFGGREDDFESMLDIIEDSARGLAHYLQSLRA